MIFFNHFFDKTLQLAEFQQFAYSTRELKDSFFPNLISIKMRPDFSQVFFLEYLSTFGLRPLKEKKNG